VRQWRGAAVDALALLGWFGAAAPVYAMGGLKDSSLN
jgi:hypothetical protein